MEIKHSCCLSTHDRLIRATILVVTLFFYQLVGKFGYFDQFYEYNDRKNAYKLEKIRDYM
jgi:hypothetical protein